jgi:hypothetical protein
VWHLTNDATNFMQLRRGTGTPLTVVPIVSVATVNQVDAITGVSTAAGTRHNAWFAYQQNNFGFSLDSSAVQTDTSGTVPAITALRLGSSSTGNNGLNGWIESFTYIPGREPNGLLQSRSAV